MTLQDIIQQLIDECGFSQGSLAREVMARGVQCTQPTICRILQGSETTDTIGQAIRQIHEEKLTDAAA